MKLKNTATKQSKHKNRKKVNEDKKLIKDEKSTLVADQ